MRYHFHIITAFETVHDMEGTDLPSLDHARAHAIEDARTLMSIAVLEGRDVSSRRIEITDGDGNVLLIVPFCDAISDESEH